MACRRRSAEPRFRRPDPAPRAPPGAWAGVPATVPTPPVGNLSNPETVVRPPPMPTFARVAVLACLFQSPAAASPAGPVPPTTAAAARTPEPVVIDGRDDDAICRPARCLGAFTQSPPLEGGPTRFRTQA